MERFVSGEGFAELRASWPDPWNVSFFLKQMPEKKKKITAVNRRVCERYTSKPGEGR